MQNITEVEDEKLKELENFFLQGYNKIIFEKARRTLQEKKNGTENHLLNKKSEPIISKQKMAVPISLELLTSPICKDCNSNQATFEEIEMSLKNESEK